MNLTSIIGILASIFTSTSLLPQLIKIVKEKDAESVSLFMLLVLFIGLALWVYYGVLKKDWIIIIANAFSLLVNISVWILSVKYKKKT